MSDRDYIQERRKQTTWSRATGVVLTVSIHVILIVGFFMTGFTYLTPPPPEQQQILIDFEEYEVKKPKQVLNGTQPRAEELSKEINLVQESQAQHIGTKANEIFGGFIIGKIIDSAIIGVLCFIGVSLLNMPYALLVSVIIGFTNVIPFFGPYIGAIPCIFLIKYIASDITVRVLRPKKSILRRPNSSSVVIVN